MKDYSEELRRTRLDFRQQMRRALVCKTKPQKIKLAKEWKEKYSELGYKELIACAKNHRVRANIANWDIDGL
jgi:hypothetical protein